MKVSDRTKELKAQSKKIERQKEKIEEERNNVVLQQGLLQQEKDKTEELLKKEKVCKTSSLGQVFWFTLVRFFKGRLSLKDALSEKSVC